MGSQKTTVLRDHTYRACHRLALLRALDGDYIINGQEPAVSQRGAGANMSVDVGAFKYLLAGVFGEKTSTTNVVIDAADATNPRIDLIYLATGGTITVSKGTAKAVKPTGESTWQKYEEPYPADLSGTSGIILAEVLVPAGATTIVDAYIRNVVVTEALALYYASEARGDLIYRNATTWARLAGVEQGSIFYEGANLDPAWLAHGDYGDRVLSGGHGANPFFAGADGWIPIPVTCTYASADDPIYTFTLPGDWTAKIRKGTRFKFTQTTAKYFICVDDPVYSSPDTTVTVYGGTDYDLANDTITDPYLSNDRFPSGFPPDENKWSVVISDSTDYSKSSPDDGTWYNLGSGALAIVAPIGKWYSSYNVFAYVYKSTYSPINIAATLSTANDSESNIELTKEIAVVGGGSNAVQMNVPLQNHWTMYSAKKTTWYLNLKIRASVSASTIGIYGARTPTRIELVCGYL